MSSLGISRLDALVAVGVLAVAATELAANPAIAPRAAAIPCEVLLAAVVAWRSRAPLVVMLMVAVLQVAEAAAGVPLQQPVVPLLASVIAAYALVTRASRPALALGAAVILAAVAGETVLQHQGFGNFLFALIFLIGTAIVGRTVKHRTRQATALRARTETLEREQVAHAQQAAAEERGRIARELHDVIAHSVSVMVVQAGAAEQIMGRDPQRAVAAVQAVQQTGRDALAEMARLLGILREGSGGLGLAPQPGLADLPALIADTKRSGLNVELHVDGESRPLPPGPELSVYRIVQEALTNVRKHAHGAQATVRLRYRPDGIEAEVRNTGNGIVPDGAVPGGGHGLIGMQERVAVYGGTLHAGPETDGSYLVRADVPVRSQA